MEKLQPSRQKKLLLYWTTSAYELSSNNKVWNRPIRIKFFRKRRHLIIFWQHSSFKLPISMI